MKKGTRKIITTGFISGLAMGITLFIAGAVFSRIIYGPQFASPGKLEPEQMNAFYFIWTKLLIGIFFGIVFTFLYEKLPLTRRIKGPVQDIKNSFIFSLVLTLWDISHPFTYGTIYNKDPLFWIIYSFCGFISFGYVTGLFYKKYKTV